MAYSLVEAGTFTVADGATVTAGSSNNLDTVTPGSGNTQQGENTSPYISSTFLRFTQGGANQNNSWWDWGSGITDPGSVMNVRYQTTPSATTTIIRDFDGVAGAGTVMRSIGITTTSKLQAIEVGPTNVNQSVSSTASLSAGTWYTLVERYVLATGAYTLTAYPQGSTTPAATVSMTMQTGYSFRSRRIGISTASSGIGNLDMDFAKFEIGSGGFAPRPDIVIAAPVVTPSAAIDRTASTSVSVGATAAVSGDTISTMTGAFTILPSGVSAPALTGTATGTGTASASLTQTFTPTVAGWYGWTATATGASSALSGTGLQMIYVAPVVGDPVPKRGATTSGYTNVGGAANLAAALGDSNDATYAESPSGPTSAAYVDEFYGPYGMSGIKYNPKLIKVGADAMTVTVYLYKSNQSLASTGSAIYSQVVTVTTSASTPDVVADGTALAALSQADRRELCWRTIGVV